jgi:hypothetical protein
MDASDSEDRRQYAEQLERAAEEQRQAYRVFSDRSKPAEERRIALNKVVLREHDEVTEALDVIHNTEEDAELRASALLAIDIEVGKRPDLIEMVIGLLRDSAGPEVLRLAALRVLQQISFSGSAFYQKRPEVFDALRAVIDDQDASLRQEALEILAQNYDEYAQRRLLAGLEDSRQALVSPEKAIQLLGYDIHAEHYPILRDTVQNPPSPEAKEEAVRLLATDPASKGLLTALLKDKDERQAVRNVSAAALQSLDPEGFQRQAKEILYDTEEYNELRATAINALTLFADQEALDEDPELTGRIEQLREEAPSKEVERTANRFLRRRRRRREQRNRSDGPRRERG